MKKLLLGLLLSPAIAFASLTQPDLALLNAANLLKNAGFENGKANWTASGGTFTISSSVTTRVYGNSGGSWDSSAAGQTLGSTYNVANSGGLSSQNGVGTCAIRCVSGTCTHKLQVYYAGAAIAESTIQSSTVNFPRTLVNFVFPTSGDVTLRLISVAANEPQAHIDSCYLGRADGYNVFRSAALTNWTSYTPIITGFGTPTNVEFAYARVGGAIQVIGKFTSGISTAVEAQLGLPDGVTTTGTTILPTIKIVGYGTFDQVGANIPTLLAEPSKTYLTVGFQSATEFGLAKKNGNGLISSGTILAFFASVPVEGWNADADAVRADATTKMWAGNHAQNCAFSRTNAAYGDPAGDASCTFSESLNLNFGTVTSFQESGNNGAGIVFQSSAADTYFVCATTHLEMGAANVGNVELVDGSNNRLSESETFTNAGGHVIPASLCGLYTVSTGGSQTIKLRTKADAGSVSLLTNFANTVSWSIFKASQSFPQPLIKNSVVSPSDDVQAIASAKLECDGSSQILSQSGSWVSAIGNIGGGVCTVTLASGIFSAAPICTVSQAIAAGSVDSVAAIVSSATSIDIFCTDNAGAACSTTTVGLICMGPK